MLLGITGSFGSGKTTVAKIFQSFGAARIDADQIAHAILQPRTMAYNKIVKVFGRGVLRKNGAIARNKLAHIVFSDRNALNKLNKIVHPQVIKSIKAKVKNSRAKIIVLDAPLLIEAGLQDMVDKLVVVKIRRRTQIRRLQERTSLGREDILKRINAQMSLTDKIRLADFVIDNSKTKEETKKQAAKIWRLLWKK